MELEESEREKQRKLYCWIGNKAQPEQVLRNWDTVGLFGTYH
jgi:hypothetical protein